MKILILNGPNLNLLGTREPELYGNVSMQDILEELSQEFSKDSILYFQSNSEAELLERIHQNDFDALVINPGAFTHYSYALADAIKNCIQPKIEVHLTHIYQRETFRQKSVTAPYTNGVITGLGKEGYRLALLFLTSQK